eukprot:3832532-Rhodomonas_salina.1
MCIRDRYWYCESSRIRCVSTTRGHSYAMPVPRELTDTLSLPVGPYPRPLIPESRPRMSSPGP